MGTMTPSLRSLLQRLRTLGGEESGTGETVRF